MKFQYQKNGKEYWRSLNQLADDPEFIEQLHREFPRGASEMDNAWSRRNFLGLMGASLALAGLASCRRPVEKIVPYVTLPEELIPGIPQHYATAMPMGDDAVGLVVTAHEGRPTKIEGNEKHPSSLGSSSIFMQAEILQLYDPDRSRTVLENGADRTWVDFVDYWRARREALLATRGQGLAILSEPFASPTLAAIKAELMKQFPEAVWVAWEPVSDENIYRGVKQAIGQVGRPRYQMDRAKVIASIESDFLMTESDAVRNARGFSDGRQINDENDSMNRLYAIEAAYSVTGAMADHRLRAKSSRVSQLAVALAGQLAAQGLGNPAPAVQPTLSAKENAYIGVLARDLMANRGASLLLAGRRQPAYVHSLVTAINHALGNVGQTVSYLKLADTEFSQDDRLVDLALGLSNGTISDLIIMGGNPALNGPHELALGDLITKTPNSVHVGLFNDESSRACHWHVPMTHFLESWGDTRAADGTAAVIQPLLEPLFGGKSPVEVVNLLATGRDIRGYEIVRTAWEKQLGKTDFENKWNRVLHDGIYVDKPAESLDRRKVDRKFLTTALAEPVSASNPDTLELGFYPDATIYDGRYANNGWLQELPDSVTKVSWDNPAQISPATAEKMGLTNGSVAKIEYDGRALETPVWIVPGQADNTIVLTLGYGRNELGRIAEGSGVDAYPLREVGSLHYIDNVKLTPTGQTKILANTQDHGSMEGRPIIREATLAGYKEDPEFAREAVEHPPLVSMWDEHKYDTGYQWGMAVDLNTCIGCNACTIACQSENNIPIVGREQVTNGREMHWIRVDRYFAGDVDEPEMLHQPVACQHCENAPCEQVCPVAATTHDSEGLNVMTYNRCIGTRYCSNNCPYKVRRFNFFNYTNKFEETIKMAQNPDVTVRSRGVMEKCTFCVQRLNRGKRKAKDENRTVVDGEIQTACQQACPTKAIVFGNINDPESRVAKVKARNRNYELLAELNVKPRTSYLAKLRNPNPELPALEPERKTDES